MLEARRARRFVSPASGIAFAPLAKARGLGLLVGDADSEAVRQPSLNPPVHRELTDVDSRCRAVVRVQRGISSPPVTTVASASAFRRHRPSDTHHDLHRRRRRHYIDRRRIAFCLTDS